MPKRDAFVSLLTLNTGVLTYTMYLSYRLSPLSSWYQPAIDAFTYALMRQFNKLPSKVDDKERNFQPLVYNTFQAYLRRCLVSPVHLLASPFTCADLQNSSIPRASD
jgi:hypothetical protein